ncbi:MAG: tRNA (adenosine(37)-N6)-threonylcarbamoyltransferase complex dimerization subunit type 1 TsaB [Solobacterium sp.]|jgi:tRNA threonylcarbamoyladenosine biosynthesis protein TsaB|nr:tRNA (adenosine(37)-N6)-threonylcarbamoyltransferase complex dimerization subunit type 1 TsaB [Solobacterium sp.]MCH4205534.1 tRNA (adenosine(37)-N6)-threonylcarbamoyltransferase complex dimerization subunit type 1 TsaB [Solobacterium sp.]MCH4227131.1 tRNA (adenosine(37)-N6)-threonylcarbamoyltransferase complex dimerization subunit type 1 TsaB [Solobacterium sp.]MCH4282297.1 tRNA (adenosine(37)-N6)-threonylcarbamoyltransferase complex dimerization subunit type 1 TsaB [Solobacterium sp.]
MITLCIDTSHTWLVLGLIQDGRMLAKVQEPCWKKQSEEIFPKLIKMMDEQKLEPENIDQIVISEGPGSYTGVRIAMTIAKVFCAMRDLPLYTLGTLQLYAGKEKCRVVTDARGKRVYTCTYENGRATGKLEAVEIADLKIDPAEKVIGDGELVGRTNVWPDIAENFLALQNEWKKAENVHLVVPEYLKPSESYLVKKA